MGQPNNKAVKRIRIIGWSGPHLWYAGRVWEVFEVVEAPFHEYIVKRAEEGLPSAVRKEDAIVLGPEKVIDWADSVTATPLKDLQELAEATKHLGVGPKHPDFYREVDDDERGTWRGLLQELKKNSLSED